MHRDEEKGREMIEFAYHGHSDFDSSRTNEKREKGDRKEHIFNNFLSNM